MKHWIYLVIGVTQLATMCASAACAVVDICKWKDWTSAILMLLLALLFAIIGTHYLEIYFGLV